MTTLVSPAAAARQLAVDPRTISRWIRAGLLPGVLLPSGRWRVAQSEIDKLTGATE